MSPAPGRAARRTPSARWLAFLAAGALMALPACDDPGAADDAGLSRDASLRDASGLLDGGEVEGGPPVRDAAPSADAGVPQCDAVCDPRSGEGCEMDARCVLYGREPACVTAAGALPPGSDCSDSSDCAQGAACFEVGGVGRCERICCPGDARACDDDQLCGGSGRLVDGTETSWGRCLERRTCDVLDPASCEAREACYIVDADGATECRIAGGGEAGDPCDQPQDCAGGYFCGGFAPSRTCRRICSLREQDCPVEEGRCVAQAHSPPESGICTVDMASRAQMNGY